MSTTPRKPYIMANYLEKLERHDPTIYSVKSMSEYCCHLTFRTDFCLLLFLYQVMYTFYRTGRSWHQIDVRRQKEGGWLMKLSYKANDRENGMGFGLSPGPSPTGEGRPCRKKGSGARTR